MVSTRWIRTIHCPAHIPVDPFGSDTRQEHSIGTAGRLNTTNFFYAANYMDRLYIGATLGLVGVRYERESALGKRLVDAALDLKDLDSPKGS